MKGAGFGGGVGGGMGFNKKVLLVYSRNEVDIKRSNLPVAFNFPSEQKLFIVFLFSLIFISFHLNKLFT